MRFLTWNECREWASGADYALGGDQEPVRPLEEPNHVLRATPREHARLTWFCLHLVGALRPHEGCLLWLTEWGVWPNSENPHLSSRLRQSYGEQRAHYEAPGHLFAELEGPDLVTFLEVAILSGWGGHLLPAGARARAFFSHDEFVEFFAIDPEIVAAFAQPLRGFGSE